MASGVCTEEDRKATAHIGGELFAPGESRTGFRSHRECEESHEYANNLENKVGKIRDIIPKFTINREPFSRAIEKNI